MKSKGILDRAGIDLSSLDSSRLRADYAAMEKEKTALQNSYKAAGKEFKAMEQNLQKICQYLHLRTNRFPGYPMILSGLFSARKPNSHHSHLVFLKLLLLFYFLHPSVLMDSQHYCTYCCDHKSDPEDECVCSTVLCRDEQQDTYQDIYCKQYDFHYNV